MFYYVNLRGFLLKFLAIFRKQMNHIVVRLSKRGAAPGDIRIRNIPEAHIKRFVHPSRARHILVECWKLLTNVTPGEVA